MSKATSFITRWSRLKHESATASQAESVERIAAPETQDGTASGQDIMPDAVPGVDMSVAPSFDPASLPPIESIVASSDIRPFLQRGVPADLTRAALRCAWTADATIRDFIGIAENQWDFNDVAGIPGFGPLGATDVAQSFLARTLGEMRTASVAIVGVSVLAAPSTAAAFDTRSDAHLDGVWLSSARATDSRKDPGVADQMPRDVTLRHDSATSPGRMQGGRRSHGGALPK